jgi:predicted metal-dependent enzyme (double-stranded beta helix superfamily)
MADVLLADVLERETVDELARDIRDILKSDSGPAGKQKICDRLSRALLDEQFVATYLSARAPGANPRELLYEDPEFGFCICGQVHDGPANSTPHDHASAWAIYGQAVGQTKMIEWKIVEKGDGDEPSLVVPDRTYTLDPGDTVFYDVGMVHSPMRDKPAKLIRIEGANIANVKRALFRAK